VSTRAPHGARKVAGELGLELVPLIDRVLVERLKPVEWGLVAPSGTAVATTRAARDVVALGGSSSCGPRVIGVVWLFSTGVVVSNICWTMSGSLMVPGFMSSEKGYLSDPVVNPHEVGVFS
jgi:hypothetical protein